MTPKIKFTVKRGTIEKREKLKDWLSSCVEKSKDGVYQLVYEPYKKTKIRSNQQNSYYWSVVVRMVADAMGEQDLEYVHTVLKLNFIGKEKVQGLTVPKSSAALSTAEFMDYIAQIQKFAAEFFGVVIPDPQEVNW